QGGAGGGRPRALRPAGQPGGGGPVLHAPAPAVRRGVGAVRRDARAVRRGGGQRVRAGGGGVGEGAEGGNGRSRGRGGTVRVCGGVGTKGGARRAVAAMSAALLVSPCVQAFAGDAAPGGAAAPAAASGQQIQQWSLEQLLNIDITTVSKS